MSGYVSDVAYTLGYYRELAPSFLNYVCTVAGVEGLKDGNRLRYCELGCGRGYGTTLLAAANPDIEFVGIDFNPTHIGEARTLAERAGIDNLKFLEISFEEAAQSREPELGDFDVVALHGVYTWVNAQIRKDIVNFLRRKLVPGGVAYVSYNTLPGWSVAGPLQTFLKEYADRTTGDSLARLTSAREQLKRLSEKTCAYIAQNPSLRTRIETMSTQDIHYLAHEFLNDHWAPIYVVDAFRDFAEAKLSYVGSANIGENRPIFALPKDMFDMLDAAPDLALKELVKDYAVNKQFRRDVYVKGPIRLSQARQKQRFNSTPFQLATSAREFRDHWRVPSGEARLKPAFVEAVFDRLNKGTATGEELVQSATQLGFSEDELQGIIEILVHNYQVVPGRPDFRSVDRSAARRLNAIVYELSLADDAHRFLAAPTIGSAIGTNYFERLLLPVILEDGSASPEHLADKALARIEGSGKRMSRDGEPLGRENFADIVSLVGDLQAKALPRWKELGIVD